MIKKIKIFLRISFLLLLDKNSKKIKNIKEIGINSPMILDEGENAQNIEKIIKFKLLSFFKYFEIEKTYL